jgi:hypothetical protein
MAVSGVVMCSGSLENNVLTGKWNVNENCIHCLNLGREVGRQNLLSLNKVKTRCINFTAKNNMLAERDLGNVGTLITTSDGITFLGLTIENSLTWGGHIDKVIKKLSSVCYMKIGRAHV